MRRAGVIAGLAILGGMAAASVLAPVVATHDYAHQDLAHRFLTPGEGGHLLGADHMGRDLFSRLVWGSRISLLVAVAATLVSVLVGVSWGIVSGYAGGWLDGLMMRVVDVLYSLPFLFLVILLMTLFLGPRAPASSRLLALLVVLGGVQWLTMARIVRGQVLSLRNRDFVVAARAMGAGPLRILARHILPNLIGIVLVYATLTVPRVILQEAFLSFLGLGVPEPFPSWGRLAAEGVRTITAVETRWWLTAYPAGAVVVTLLALHLVGDGLTDPGRGRSGGAAADGRGAYRPPR